MIDWFVILTPLLLMSIAVFLFFLGCGTGEIINPQVEVTFAITFYLVDDNQLENHLFYFEIRNEWDKVVAEATKTVDVETQGENGKASKVRQQFTDLLRPGLAALSCRVIDTDNQTPVVANGCDWLEVFESNEQYFILFDADVSDDGMVPDTEFTSCYGDMID